MLQKDTPSDIKGSIWQWNGTHSGGPYVSKYFALIIVSYILSVFLLIGAGAIYQSGMFALAAKLPGTYMQSYIVGQVIVVRMSIDSSSDFNYSCSVFVYRSLQCPLSELQPAFSPSVYCSLQCPLGELQPVMCP